MKSHGDSTTTTIQSLLETNSASEEKFQLKQKIGLWRGVSILLGTIVGSGIFISPVGVLAQANGSVGVSLLLWAACGLFSAITALCYAELGTSVVESGAEFAFLNAAYGGPLAFMHIICFIFVLTPASSAASAITFGTYIITPFYQGCDPPVTAIKTAAAACVLTVGLVNYLSVRTAAKLQLVFTVAKLLGMMIIVIAGFARLGMGDPVGMFNFANAFNSDALAGISAGGIGLAFYQGLFSYGGWNRLTFMTEEVKDVSTTLPRAIITSLILVTSFYIAINIAYLSLLTPAEMIASKSVAVTFGSKIHPSFIWIMPVLVSFSVFGSLVGNILTGGRKIFAAGRREHLPQVVSMIHTGHRTPAPAIIVNVTMILIFIIPGDFDTLISIVTTTTWIFYGLCAAAVLVLRKKYPDLPRPYKVPTALPVIASLFAVFLVIVPLVSNPKLDYLYGLALMVISGIVYYPMVFRKYRLPGMDRLTVFLQQGLDIAPPYWEDTLAEAKRNE